jgi:hypothetical protein
VHTIFKLMIPVGIATGLVLVFVILTGLRWIKVKVKVHRIAALVATVGMLFHAAVAVYVTYLLR